MSGSSLKNRLTPSESSDLKENFMENWKRDWEHGRSVGEFLDARTPYKTWFGDDDVSVTTSENKPDRPFYEKGFPTQWGVMSGPMVPLQSIDGWQLNPSQVDALMAAGMGQQGVAMPFQGSFLARLAALQNGGRNVS